MDDLKTELAHLDPTMPMERILNYDDEQAAVAAEVQAMAADAGGGERKLVGGGLAQKQGGGSGRPARQRVIMRGATSAPARVVFTGTEHCCCRP